MTEQSSVDEYRQAVHDHYVDVYDHLIAEEGAKPKYAAAAASYYAHLVEPECDRLSQEEVAEKFDTTATTVRKYRGKIPIHLFRSAVRRGRSE